MKNLVGKHCTARLASVGRFTCLVAGIVSCGPVYAEGGGEPIRFNRDIRPILAAHCFRCHGPDGSQRQSGLRLDTRQGALADREGTPAVVPGRPEQSALWTRISSSDESRRMPPAEAGDPLTPEQQQLLRQWIVAGAPYQQHWAFVPPAEVLPPKTDGDTWCRTPIDRFVLARIEKKGLSPSPPAGPYTLLRRVALALTGLPPTPSEIDRFVADKNPGAYEAMVDHYLASSAYGERWAAVWLDLARYADSAGYAQDPLRAIWPYRDWVIRAINRNLPFDKFTIDQIAGDLLPESTIQQKIATGFHRNTMTNSEGGTDDEEFRNAAIVDRVNTTMQVWMGVTMGCAQCHEHKFDPISNREYFKLFAIFNNTADSDKGDERPTIPVPMASLARRRAELKSEISRLEDAPADQPDDDAGAADPTESHAGRLERLKKELAELEPYRTPVMEELSGDARRETRIQLRGNFRNVGDRVEPGVPDVFPPLSAQRKPDRLALAMWLVDPRNPLTARVTVNRFWDQLMGRGLVATSEDFGNQGALPSHPDLLDYLAVQFMRHGWDTKWLVRQIVTSATFRQSARADADAIQRDVDNVLLARGPRFRLSAEMIRDQALAVAGLLSRKMYGPPVRPPRPKLGLNSAFGGSTDWETSPGEDRFRRAIYTMWRRTTPYPSMTTFDAPSREFCCIRRIRTNTPLQALVTLNDPVYVEAAQGLARRVVKEGGSTVHDRLSYLVKVCLGRPPDKVERERLVQLHDRVRRRLIRESDNAAKLATVPLGSVGEENDLIALATWTVVGNVVMNLDEFLTRP